ncbi:unnamed protein product [Allacma fusca]|uniref:Uncharacterized protein n=1 Tax=Allacma fusca TaxID=39272 RepID=A0A8J2K440_9HEXA|nr:unnamed protein product [Allacma fusca]
MTAYHTALVAVGLFLLGPPRQQIGAHGPNEELFPRNQVQFPSGCNHPEAGSCYMNRLNGTAVVTWRE